MEYKTIDNCDYYSSLEKKEKNHTLVDAVALVLFVALLIITLA